MLMEKKIAVIGPSQAGKTCLAAGLYGINHKGVVSVDAVDDEIRNYLVARQQELAGGVKFPEGTVPGLKDEDKRQIRLQFTSKGHAAVTMEFLEFAGERLNEDARFAELANGKDSFKELDGVVLLVNPGAKAFEPGNESAMVDFKAQYMRVLRFLYDDPNSLSGGAPAALAVTAADRLEGDLRERRGAVDAFMGELEAYLEQRGKKPRRDYQRFNVTVTGALADPEKPRLARGKENTAPGPFLWLIDQLVWRPVRIRQMNVAACVAGTVLAVAAAGWGVARVRHAGDAGRRLAECRRDLDACCEQSCPTAERLAAAGKALAWLRGDGARSAKGAQLAAEYGGKVEEGLRRRIRREIDAFKAGNGGGREEIDALFATWRNVSPGESEAREISLREWAEARFDAEAERAVKGDSLKAIAALLPGRARLGEGLTEEFVRRREANLRRAYEERYETFLAEVAVAASKRGELNGDDKSKVVRMATETGEPFDFGAAWAELERRVGATVRAATEQQRGACDEWVKKHVYEGSKRTGEEGLVRKYEKARERGELKGNPLFDEIVRSAVYRQAEAWLEEDVRKMREAFPQTGDSVLDRDEDAQKRFVTLFNGFKELCMEIAKDNAPAPESWAWRFACLCRDQGRIGDGLEKCFPQTLIITKIEGRIDYKKFPVNYIHTILAPAWRTEGWNPRTDSGIISKVLQEKDNRRWISLWEGRFEHLDGLFTKVSLVVKATDANLNQVLKEKELLMVNFTGGNGNWSEESWKEGSAKFPVKRWTGDKNPTVGLRVFGKRNGPTPEGLLLEAKQAVGRR
jgi:hypothetical protein